MRQFLNLKSNFYFLKNIVFALFCFILGYLLGSGVISAKAETLKTINYYYPQNLESAYDNSDIRDYLGPIEDALQKTNKYYAIVISTMHPTSTSTVHLDENTLLRSFYVDRIYIFDKKPIFRIKPYGKYMDFVNEDGTDIRYKNFASGLTLNFNENGKATMNKIIEQINNFENFTNNNSYFTPYVNGITFDTTISKSSTHKVLYSTNFDLKIDTYDSHEDDRYTIKISENLLVSGNSFLNLKDIYVPKTFTEDFRIDSKNIDRIEYTFDVPSNKKYSFEFNFSTTWYSSIARFDMFTPPYFEYITGEKKNKLPLDVGRSSTLEQVLFSGTQINVFDENSQVKFIVNFDTINALDDSSVFIHFDSEYDFTRKIIYTSDPESNAQYLKEVDWTDKYAIYLIPKVVNDSNEEIYSNIKYQGRRVYIQLRDSNDFTKEPISTLIDDWNVGNAWGNYTYLFRTNNVNHNIFFINKDYLADEYPSKLIYDTRYFVHSICSTPTSCETITNPNTNEEWHVKPPGTDGDGQYSSIDEIYDTIDKFFDKANERVEYVQTAFSNFFDNMPDWFQMICIVLYIFLHIFVILRIGGFSHDS